MTTTAMNETPMGASPQGGKLAGRKASMSALAKRAVIDSFAKLTPREQAKNPVMLMVYISAILTLGLFALSLFGIADAHPAFIFAVSAVLWLTVLFANFAEALAEGRGKAQADSLRAAKRDIDAHKLNEGLVAKGTHADDPAEFFRLNAEEVSSAVLKKKDLFYVAANEQIPADGEIVMGAASVDESAITGESAPVIRETGGDRSAVTGGTTVLSDWLVVRGTADAGHSFLDQMIAMVESAARKKTPNEIALEILLIALTIVFLVVSVSLFAFSRFGASQEGIANPTTIASLVALFVCLAPTTIGALLSAIGIAGMSRLNQANVLAMSGRAVEAAGDVDVLLLDKTGTITLGTRQAAEFIPVDGASEREVADAAQLASLTDETPEGRSIVVLAKELFDIRARVLEGAGMTTIPFTAQTRMSGVDFEGHEIRKGAADAVKSYVESCGGTYSAQCAAAVEHVSRAGGTPLLVARDHRILGVVYLKDIVKQGIKENFADLRTMGIKTVMITGDHASTARAIGRHRRRGRRGRFHRRGHARDEACRHPAVPGRGTHGGHDGRRHERRAGARAGRRGRGHEQRHPGGERGRQHGGPRFQPHEAHRHRAHRQTAAYDARQPDHVLHRQRRGEVLRHHPGVVRAVVPRARGAQHHAPDQPHHRHLGGRHIQRAHHRGAHPVGS